MILVSWVVGLDTNWVDEVEGIVQEPLCNKSSFSLCVSRRRATIPPLVVALKSPIMLAELSGIKVLELQRQLGDLVSKSYKE
jgi:hypothetical protein